MGFELNDSQRFSPKTFDSLILHFVCIYIALYILSASTIVLVVDGKRRHTVYLYGLPILLCVAYFSVQLVSFPLGYFDRNIRLFVQQASEKRPKSGGKIGEKKISLIE